MISINQRWWIKNILKEDEQIIMKKNIYKAFIVNHNMWSGLYQDNRKGDVLEKSSNKRSANWEGEMVIREMRG